MKNTKWVERSFIVLAINLILWLFGTYGYTSIQFVALTTVSALMFLIQLMNEERG